MENRKFQVGDRVVVNTDLSKAEVRDGSRNSSCYMKGMEGVICSDDLEHRLGDGRYSVAFDREFANGHSCNGMCDRGHGYNIHPEYLDLPAGSDCVPVEWDDTMYDISSGSVTHYRAIYHRAIALCSESVVETSAPEIGGLL